MPGFEEHAPKLKAILAVVERNEKPGFEPMTRKELQRAVRDLAKAALETYEPKIMEQKVDQLKG